MKAKRQYLVAAIIVLLAILAGGGVTLSAPSQNAGVTVEDNGWVDCVHDAPLDWDNEQLGSAAFWQEGITGAGHGAWQPVKVAVIDTGVDGTHGAFLRTDGSSRVLSGEDFDTNPLRRDCSGRQWDGQQYSFVNLDDSTDCSGHGTHVAGIVAADGGMAGGPIRGVAPGANVLPKKVFSLVLVHSIVKPRELISGGEQWIRTFTLDPSEIPAGTPVVLDFQLTWTNANHPLRLYIESPFEPMGRAWWGEDHAGQLGKVLLNIPTQRQ